jgi:hypothetical protein
MFELLARALEIQLPVLIVFTGRTPAEQAALYAIGRTDGQPPSARVTWTLESKHVMSPKQDMKSLAMDICPFDLYQLNGPDKLKWDAADPSWDKLGAIGEGLGLVWGGRWKVRDLGHFEFAGTIT